MFGYVTPCKMELKIKDYEKFKSYYCGLCREIKKSYGNIPRITLNYDMTFLSILLDSLSLGRTTYKTGICLVHPNKKRTYIHNSNAIEYAAFCNVILAYYKLKDDKQDNKSIKSYFYSNLIGFYINKGNKSFSYVAEYIEKRLTDLYNLEKNNNNLSIDELSDPFSQITGFILSSYIDFIQVSSKERTKQNLFNLGYNLGKWIYIIDAYDDLYEDMKKNKFNPLEKAYNVNKLNFNAFRPEIADNVDFILTNCASSCLENLDKLPITKNEDLLQNILQLGLMEKMNTVYKRSEQNEKSI
ncbi:MAG: DUF5685 family protein [Clostridiaceae bacterium]